ncbi:serine hydrolase [Massilia sp. CF038]|uniref:serine hydrolase domain-containing protein n=1 Tax=Massilia sp. CF038 TaxID=1881045 RepID=UPI00091EBA90|nr:serine hydrolase domain-containing protein [Massilia sp. CF038]SHH43985.1 CubicO group peptidase, beta-lactamase class C family [Massilia sp. CF038]
MLKLTPFCLAAVLLLQLPVSVVQAAPVAAKVDQALAAKIDAAIAPMYKADEPGVTVIVTKEGKTVLRKAYGRADVAGKVAMTPDMTLRLGSITKQFTAVAILMLAEEGKLSLSDPITTFLPDYPMQGKIITIEHLLTHTSGIVSFTGKPDYVKGMTRDLTPSAMIDSFKNDALEFEPGTRMKYNNSGYFVLGAIIEKISGVSYANFLEQRIFTPLGMVHTAYEGSEKVPPLRAVGHSKDSDGFVLATPLSMTQPYAAGALVSTVDDLAIWDAAISAGKLLKPDSWARAFTSYKLADGKLTNYGYGWGIDSLRGTPMIAHGGGINGFSTFALRLPEKKVFVAVLANIDGGLASPDFVARKIAAIAAGNPFPVLKAIKSDPAVLAAATGVYQQDEKLLRTVRFAGGKLTMQRGDRSPVEIVPYAKDSYFVPDTFSTFTFERDAKGQVTQLTLHEDGKDIVSKRTGDAPPPAKGFPVSQTTLDAYSGRFELAPRVVLTIKREGDKLIGQVTGQPAYALVAESESVFAVSDVPAKVRFDGNDKLVLLQNGQEYPGSRLK